MLKITKTLEYALIALNHIQKNSDLICSAKDLSIKYMIPYHLLAKILQKMAKLDYIHAVKGANGGYKLNKSLEKINLTEFIESLEGPIGLVDCILDTDCIQIEHCNIKSPINKINQNIRLLFKNISIADITA